MVRVLAIADEVVPSLYAQRAREIAPDLVVAAGDLPWEYVEHVVSVTDVPVAWVPGNHDPAVTDGPPPGVVDVDGKVADLAGLRVAGLGGCVRYKPGPHQYTQREYRTRLRRLRARLRRHAWRNPGGLDLLVTHAPPFGLGDESDRCHVGIEALPAFLTDVQPTWHLHGHVHPYGRTMPDRTVGRTTLRNVIPSRVLEVVPLRATTERAG